MPKPVPVYLEVGNRRVFAGALDWPGWCRNGRSAEAALDALVAYGPRYGAAMGSAARGYRAPRDPTALEVVERVKGDATTDFGAPGGPPKSDRRPLEEAELRRLTRLLRASWAAFDSAARSARGARLRKGPRGGGRELHAIVSHVLDADQAYLGRLGGRYRKPGSIGVAEAIAGVRRALLDAVAARAHGDPPEPSRRRAPLWLPRYGVRRSAWHALDHAWEIEDRAGK